jgi:hypothetical protein
MALGTVQISANAVISVSTTLAGTYSPISDLNSVSKNSQRTISQIPVLQRAVAYGIPGAREVTMSLGGFLSVGDTGQDILRAAEDANTTVFIKVLPDGTNGWTQEMRVGSQGYAMAPDGLQEFTWELASVAAAAIVGTGPKF